MEITTCTSILKSGERRGEMCNRACATGSVFCRRHHRLQPTTNPPHRRPSSTNNILCTYDPPYLFFNSDEANGNDGDEILVDLNGYINVQILDPVFKNDSKLSLALMSRIKPGCDYFTKKSLAIEILNELDWVIMHGEGFDKNVQSLSELELKNISYDVRRGLYIANFNKIL